MAKQKKKVAGLLGLVIARPLIEEGIGKVKCETIRSNFKKTKSEKKKKSLRNQWKKQGCSTKIGGKISGN